MKNDEQKSCQEQTNNVIPMNPKRKLELCPKFSVSQYIKEKYDISILPGKKGECYFCGKNTFSIKADDSFGKCFHPECGRWINYKSLNNNYVQRVAIDIYKVFRDELYSKVNETPHVAYKYLVDERKIDPSVILNCMLGAVPVDIDVQYKALSDEIFDKYINELEEKAENTENPDKWVEQHKKLRELKMKFQNIFQYALGYLAFFYVDQYNNITQIKIRKPYDKKILIFKIKDQPTGVFNCSTYVPSDQPWNKYKKLFVTEGEFNSLQLASLVFRYGKNISTCAIGGVLNADYKTLKGLSDNVCICYDNDESNAGYELVEKAKNVLSFHAFTTPEINSDLDEFILKFGEDYKKALQSFGCLI